MWKWKAIELQWLYEEMKANIFKAYVTTANASRNPHKSKALSKGRII
jgi:hypothetical protein